MNTSPLSELPKKSIPRGPCRKCGKQERNKTGVCVPCARRRVRAWRSVPKNLEKIRNPKKPCRRCGSSERGSAGNCLPCSRERTRAWLAIPENREKAKLRSQQRYQENPEVRQKMAERALAWQRSEAGRQWRSRRARTPHVRLIARRNYQKRVADPKYREQQREYLKQYRSVPGRKEHFKELYRAKKYGISVEDQRAMWARQGGRCAVCPEILKNDKHTHLDHDHKTKKVRGFLCSKCNQAIGFVRDNPVIADRIATYLRGHSA
jgi:Recombination endonuclease VII